MHDIGIGLVALGWMGRLHTRGYRALRERYPELGVRPRLVVAAEASAAGRADAVERFGFERAVAHYREVLADPCVDVVSICTPNYLHHEVAMAAVAAGKPFWIEKPMGVNAAQSREIARAAETAGLVTGVGFNYRHQPAIQHSRDLIRSGRLGRLTNARIWLLADYASSPEGPLTWRFSREQGGAGVVGDLMSHGVDLANYLVGRVGSLTAMTDTFITDRPLPLEQGVGHSAVRLSHERGAVENEDHVAVLARTDGGVVVTLEASRVAHGPRAEYVVEVYGTCGSLRWNYEAPMHLQVHLADADESGYTTIMVDTRHGDFGRFQPGPGNSMSFDDLKAIEAKLFVESVLMGTQLAPSAADAWAAAEADEAIIASAADGRWHTVPEVVGRTTFDAEPPTECLSTRG